MATTPSEQERIFREWMREQMAENGMRRYTDNAIIAYCYSLRTACHKMVPPVAGNLFGIGDEAEYNATYERILAAHDYEQVNRENGNGTLGVALRLYKVFLSHGAVGRSFDMDAPFYLQNSAAQPKPAYSGAEKGGDIHYKEVPMEPMQCIYYGAPGTGKSHTVQQILEKEYPDKEERDAHCKRMIFHPTCKYEDFVGSIKPLMSLDRPLDYIYSAGPFTALLKDAFSHPEEKYFLIIEEINRGNSPAIFGDLFQLLDRQENGKSSYAVHNVDISAYFAKDPSLKKMFNDGKIWLPANFNILATMNTADENIFVLDSAFKRRFRLEYVKIDFDELPEKWTLEYETFAGEKPLGELFMGTRLEDFARSLAREGKLRRNWPTYARMCNHLIDALNSETISLKRPELARIAENKKLGPFFVSAKELAEPSNFINKVIFYLKQDVFTYSDHYMLDSFEEIYIKYLENKGDLFELLR